VVQLDFGVPLLAAAIERGFVRPFNREANAVGWMLTTIAVGTMIESATTALFGERLMATRAASFNYYYLIAACLMLTLWVHWALARSRYGRAMRATAESENASRALGINSIFCEVPARNELSDEFVRQYYRYADQLYACYLSLASHAQINCAEFEFDLYASGEYSRLLEKEWTAVDPE
jgi:hypothetical protein